MSKIAVLFSGQGAQAVGMGLDLYNSSKEAKALYDMGEALNQGTISTCFYGEASELTLTENAQPCLFLTSLAFANELKKADIKIDATAGFSLGEIPALAFSGILSEADAFRLVLARSKKMAELSRIHNGGMVAALKAENSVVENLCAEFSEVWPVNYNCPGQLSCAGKPEELDKFLVRLKEAGARGVKLAVSGAFHTPYMKEAGDTLRNELQKMDIKPPSLPIYANINAEKYPSEPEAIIETVANQVCSPVRWEGLLRNMHSDGIDTFIEVGAGATLTGFVKRTLPDSRALTVTDVASLESVINEIKGGMQK